MGAIERLTITMPVAMAAALRESVEGGEYASTSEIIREAVRDWTKARDADRRELDALRALIREGMESGPSIPADQVFAELREKIMARRAQA